MKFRTVMITAVSILFVMSGMLYAATGDLIVNGNLGVGTQNPAGKAEVNGNMIVDGNLGVGTTFPTEKAEINGNLKVQGAISAGEQNGNGSLCVNGKCTGSLTSVPIWDYTVTGSPVTSVTSPTLDGNADGGYEFEFWVLSTVGTVVL